MSPLTCPQVEDRLELYAADECDTAEAQAILSHLSDCPLCAAACDEARQLMGLLDLRLQEPERLRRLQDRLAAEDNPRRQVLRFPTTLRRVAALAALLLLTIGPIGWLMQGLQTTEDNVGLTIALNEKPAVLQRIPADIMAPAMEKRGPEEANERDAPARLSPPVELSLRLRNTTDKPLHVWLSGTKTELLLDVRGPGVKCVPAQRSHPAQGDDVVLRPGEGRTFRITILTDDRHSWYLTEPGDYTVSAQFTTRASAPGKAERSVTVRSDPIIIPFKGR